jgi:hypothetical protein
LLDKISILEIKAERIKEPEKLTNVRHELSLLYSAWLNLPIDRDGAVIVSLRHDLKSVNDQLWKIEDQIRDFERLKVFEEEFIRLARAVYITNDRRSAIKREIDMLLGSVFTEEKAYRPY